MNIKKIATAAKPKKPRAKTVAHIKLGNEPKLMILPTDIQVAAALNWYNRTETTPEQRCQWVLDFMADNSYSKDQLATFKQKNKKFIPTFGHLARIINNGSTLEDKHVRQLVDAINAHIKSVDDQDDDLDEDGNLIVNPPAKATPKRDKTPFVVAEFIEYIDEQMDRVLVGEKVGSLYQTFINRGLSSIVANRLIGFYKPQALEFYELKSGACDQLDEGYAHLNKKTRKAISDWMVQLVTDLDTVVNNKRVVRKARKPKPKKVEQVVKHVKYQKEATDFKVVSVNPTQIIGAKALWVFNTKTRQLGCYVAADSTGLSVKGTTIVNGAGEMKKIRKPVEFLEAFTGTQKSLDMKYKAVRSVPVKMNGRLNQYTILLRVH